MLLPDEDIRHAFFMHVAMPPQKPAIESFALPKPDENAKLPGRVVRAGKRL